MSNSLPLFDAFANPIFSSGVLFLLGIVWGSFGNVCIYRIPNNESVVHPPSACPGCKKKIKPFQNIPILSWLFLLGRCAHCGIRISWRYPLVEFLVGMSFVLLFWEWGWSWTLLEYCIFSFGLIVVSFIDLDHMILPDRFTLTGILIGIVGAFINPERSFIDALIGAFLGGGFLLLIGELYFRFKKIEGMGGGDIKLLGWIGALLGWQALPFVLLVSSVLGFVIGGFYLIKSKKGLQVAIPFGPFLSLGALIYIFFDGQYWLEHFLF